MKTLQESMMNEAKEEYKAGDIIPVMYTNTDGNGVWEFGYIVFSIWKSTGKLYPRLSSTIDGPMDERARIYTILKFEDFDPNPKKHLQNLKKAFIKIGVAASDYKIIK